MASFHFEFSIDKLQDMLDDSGAPCEYIVVNPYPGLNRPQVPFADFIQRRDGRVCKRRTYNPDRCDADVIIPNLPELFIQDPRKRILLRKPVEPSGNPDAKSKQDDWVPPYSWRKKSRTSTIPKAGPSTCSIKSGVDPPTIETVQKEQKNRISTVHKDVDTSEKACDDPDVDRSALDGFSCIDKDLKISDSSQEPSKQNDVNHPEPLFLDNSSSSGMSISPESSPQRVLIETDVAIPFLGNNHAAFQLGWERNASMWDHRSGHIPDSIVQASRPGLSSVDLRRTLSTDTAPAPEPYAAQENHAVSHPATEKAGTSIETLEDLLQIYDENDSSSTRSDTPQKLSQDLLFQTQSTTGGGPLIAGVDSKNANPSATTLKPKHVEAMASGLRGAETQGCSESMDLELETQGAELNAIVLRDVDAQDAVPKAVVSNTVESKAAVPITIDTSPSVLKSLIPKAAVPAEPNAAVFKPAEPNGAVRKSTESKTAEPRGAAPAEPKAAIPAEPNAALLKPVEPDAVLHKSAGPMAALRKSTESKTAVAAEPKAAVSAEPSAAEFKPAVCKSAEPKASVPKLTESRTAEPRDAVFKPAETNTAVHKSADPKAAVTKFAESKTAEPKAAVPAEPKAAAVVKPAELKNAGRESAEPKASASKSTEFKTAEPKAAVPSEPKAAVPAEPGATVFKPAEPNAAVRESAEPKASVSRSTESKTAEDKAASPAEPRAAVTAEPIATVPKSAASKTTEPKAAIPVGPNANLHKSVASKTAEPKAAIPAEPKAALPAEPKAALPAGPNANLHKSAEPNAAVPKSAESESAVQTAAESASKPTAHSTLITGSNTLNAMTPFATEQLKTLLCGLKALLQDSIHPNQSESTLLPKKDEDFIKISDGEELPKNPEPTPILEAEQYSHTKDPQSKSIPKATSDDIYHSGSREEGKPEEAFMDIECGCSSASTEINPLTKKFLEAREEPLGKLPTVEHQGENVSKAAKDQRKLILTSRPLEKVQQHHLPVSRRLTPEVDQSLLEKQTTAHSAQTLENVTEECLTSLSLQITPTSSDTLEDYVKKVEVPESSAENHLVLSCLKKNAPRDSQMSQYHCIETNLLKEDQMTMSIEDTPQKKRALLPLSTKKFQKKTDLAHRLESQTMEDLPIKSGYCYPMSLETEENSLNPFLISASSPPEKLPIAPQAISTSRSKEDLKLSPKKKMVPDQLTVSLQNPKLLSTEEISLLQSKTDPLAPSMEKMEVQHLFPVAKQSQPLHEVIPQQLSSCLNKVVVQIPYLENEPAPNPSPEPSQNQHLKESPVPNQPPVGFPIQPPQSACLRKLGSVQIDMKIQGSSKMEQVPHPSPLAETQSLQGISTLQSKEREPKKSPEKGIVQELKIPSQKQRPRTTSPQGVSTLQREETVQKQSMEKDQFQNQSVPAVEKNPVQNPLIVPSQNQISRTSGTQGMGSLQSQKRVLKKSMKQDLALNLATPTQSQSSTAPSPQGMNSLQSDDKVQKKSMEMDPLHSATVPPQCSSSKTPGPQGMSTLQREETVQKKSMEKDLFQNSAVASVEKNPVQNPLMMPSHHQSFRSSSPYGMSFLQSQERAQKKSMPEDTVPEPASLSSTVPSPQGMWSLQNEERVQKQSMEKDLIQNPAGPSQLQRCGTQKCQSVSFLQSNDKVQIKSLEMDPLHNAAVSPQRQCSRSTSPQGMSTLQKEETVQKQSTKKDLMQALSRSSRTPSPQEISTVQSKERVQKHSLTKDLVHNLTLPAQCQSSEVPHPQGMSSLPSEERVQKKSMKLSVKNSAMAALSQSSRTPTSQRKSTLQSEERVQKQSVEKVSVPNSVKMFSKKNQNIKSKSQETNCLQKQKVLTSTLKENPALVTHQNQNLKAALEKSDEKVQMNPVQSTSNPPCTISARMPPNNQIAASPQDASHDQSEVIVLTLPKEANTVPNPRCSQNQSFEAVSRLEQSFPQSEEKVQKSTVKKKQTQNTGRVHQSVSNPKTACLQGKDPLNPSQLTLKQQSLKDAWEISLIQKEKKLLTSSTKKTPTQLIKELVRPQQEKKSICQNQEQEPSTSGIKARQKLLKFRRRKARIEMQAQLRQRNEAFWETTRGTRMVVESSTQTVEQRVSKLERKIKPETSSQNSREYVKLDRGRAAWKPYIREGRRFLGKRLKEFHLPAQSEGSPSSTIRKESQRFKSLQHGHPGKADRLNYERSDATSQLQGDSRRSRGCQEEAGGPRSTTDRQRVRAEQSISPSEAAGNCSSKTSEDGSSNESKGKQNREKLNAEKGKLRRLNSPGSRSLRSSARKSRSGLIRDRPV